MDKGDTTPLDTAEAIAALDLRERDLELQAVAIKSRTEEIREMREMLLRSARRRRPPRNASALNPHPPQMAEARLNPHPSQILELPDRVGGGMGENEPESAA